MESILGLEFTQDSIKLLELGLAEDGPRFLRLNKIDLPANSIKEGIISAPNLVAAKLGAFLKENNITTKKVVPGAK